MMRLRALAAFALLVACAGCSKSQEASDPATHAASTSETIACAVGGAAEMADVCTVERIKAGGALQLVVHHPDGAFRRFDVLSDGTGLAPADGAQEPVRNARNGILEIAIGGDRYRFPATIAGDAAKP